jgi:osmoprotectant transport system ATP-binding protein
VDDCSLTVEEGQLVVLLGPSGCGKTTLLKMVNRIIEPTAGRILVDDTDIQTLPATELRRRIGYVIQQIGLFPHMSVEDNVATVPRLLHWDKARIDGRIDELLNLVNLPPATYRKRRPRQLSGGEQQRVGIARAMAADPALLLMDEPFGAIDAITRTHLQDQMLHIQQQVHKTILFVTHDVEEALRLADVLVVMRNGRILQAGAPRDILAYPADAFVAELVGADDPLRRLSLVPVAEIMQPLGRRDGDSVAGNGHTISTTGDARTALGLLVGDRTARVTVVDGDGRPVGTVALDDIEAAAGVGAGAKTGVHRP